MPHFNIEKIKERFEVKKVSRIILVIAFFLFLIMPSLFRNRIEGRESRYEKRYLNEDNFEIISNLVYILLFFLSILFVYQNSYNPFIYFQF